MRKILFLVCIALFFYGCEKKENSENNTNLSKSITTKDINKTIDNFAKEAKEFANDLSSAANNATKQLNNFVNKNKQNIQNIKTQATKALKDINQSMNKLKSNLNELAQEANKSLNGVFKEFKNDFKKDGI